MNTKRIAAVFLAAVALMAAFGLITQAQQPAGPALPTNEYGTPDMSQIELAQSGHYEQCAAFCTSVPGLGDTGVMVEYDLYTDNYGSSWVVPSPLTVLVTAVFPEYTLAGLASRSDGWAYGSLLMGMVEAAGGLDALGIDVGGVTINTDQELRAVLRDFAEMEGDHLGFMLQLGRALADSGGNAAKPSFVQVYVAILSVSGVIQPDLPSLPGNVGTGSRVGQCAPLPAPASPPTTALCARPSTGSTPTAPPCGRPRRRPRARRAIAGRHRPAAAPTMPGGDTRRLLPAAVRPRCSGGRGERVDRIIGLPDGKIPVPSRHYIHKSAYIVLQNSVFVKKTLCRFKILRL